LKPIFTDMQVYSHQQDAGKPLLHRMYEGVVGGTQTVLQNHRGEVATTVEISGSTSDPATSTWALVVGLIQNAFIKAIRTDLSPRPVALSDRRRPRATSCDGGAPQANASISHAATGA
jgi:hypothetical protein